MCFPPRLGSIFQNNSLRFANPAEALGGSEDSRLGGLSIYKKGTRVGTNKTERESKSEKRQKDWRIGELKRGYQYINKERG